MARYGTPGEFSDAEECRERQVRSIPKAGDKGRKEERAKPQSQN